MVAALILLAPGITTRLASSALAAVVVAAAVALADVGGVARLARLQHREFVFSVVAFAGVALFGVLRGIGVAVALSLLSFVARATQPYMAELVRVDQRKGCHDLGRHPEGRRIPGLVIARFDAPLFFANAMVFVDFVRRLVDASPGTVRWVAGLDPPPGSELTVTAPRRHRLALRAVGSE